MKIVWKHEKRPESMEFNKKSNIHIIGLLEKEKKRGEVEKLFKKIMIENFSHFLRDLNLQIQETGQIANRIKQISSHQDVS